jgi:hypothetical protein
MAERDYPEGHPAASDYKGTPYVDRFASYQYDFPEGHPARAGKNVSHVDTPDGMREVQMKTVTPLKDLAKQGSLPPMFAPGRKEPLALAPEALAHIYASRAVADFDKAPTDADVQALQYVQACGFNHDEAVELYRNYAQPEKRAN